MESLKNRKTIRLKNYDYSQSGAYFITICTYNRECFLGEIIKGEMNLNEGGKNAKKFWEEIPVHYPYVIIDEFVVMPNHIHGIIIINKNSVGVKNIDVGVQNIEPHIETHIEPRNNIRNIVGVQNIEPHIETHIEPRNNIRDIVGVQDIEPHIEPRNNIRNIVGVQNIEPHIEPRNNIRDIVGVQNIDVGVQYFEPLHYHQNQYQKIIPGSIGSIVRGFKIAVTKWFRQNTDIYTVWQRNYYEHIIRNNESMNKIRQYIRNNPLKWEMDSENIYKRKIK